MEYACVGYTDKRIQLRKNRFEAMKKVMEEKRQEVAKQMEMQAVNTHDGASYYTGRLGQPVRGPPNRQQYKQAKQTPFVSASDHLFLAI